MAQPAQITSIEAIESFRAGLIVYIGKARAALDEVHAELLRARLWIQNDQRRKWEQEMRLRLRRAEEAKNELFAARLSSFQQASALHVMAVQRAERAIKEAEDKLAVIKKWDREMQNRADPLAKQVEQLQGFLVTDMGKAAIYLGEIVKSLDAYVNAVPSAAPSSPADVKGPTS